MLKRILERLLWATSRAILTKYQPIVIGITGSVGKTSTKEAVATVLRARFSVRANTKSYNNQIGVPLSILGVETGKRSLLRWIGVFGTALRLWVFRDATYPKVLVLEMGADRVGDLKYLTALAPCNIGVVTAIAEVHTEFFGTIEGVVEEKAHVVSHLAAGGTAVLNADDPRALALRSRTRARVFTFGFQDAADIRGLDVHLSDGGEPKAGLTGLSCKVSYQGTVVPLYLPGVLGSHQAYAALAAASVGLAMDMNLVDIAEALKTYVPPPGRMKLLRGVKDTFLIDDTYNASPVSALAALTTLVHFPNAKRHIACLGDMAELGQYAEEGHRRVGEEVARQGVDYLLTVGPNAKRLAAAAQEHGMPADHISMFDFSPEAGKSLQNFLEPGDVVLIKGSQVARMEKIVKEVMAHPEEALRMLVRQEAEWQG